MLDASEAFRRHFEARFKPLPGHRASKVAKRSTGDDEDYEDAGSEWSGLSSETEPQPIIVEHKELTLDEIFAKKNADKVLLDVRNKEDLNSGDRLDLKNDLALQRLINESHLLNESSFKGLGSRQKLIDIRLRALGVKQSASSQELKKMPMSHRRGILAKAAEREQKRRVEAKENGIILERPEKKRGKENEEKRLRGIGGPGIGKFKGGTLNLSKRDVASVKASSRSGSFKRKGKR